MKTDVIDTVALDADDTLWHMETLFHLTHEKFTRLLTPYHSPHWIKKKLYEVEMRNLDYFGYGVKGFTLSMIETAIELTDGRIPGSEIQHIVDYARQMVEAPVELLDHVRETVAALSGSYCLMLVTKGDLFDQESKIARSGLADFFDHIEILSRKDTAAYRGLFKKYRLKPRQFIMVGNSLKSDILPVLGAGGHAVYIPYPLCWEHEKVDHVEPHQQTYHQLEHIGGLPRLLEDLNAAAGSPR